MTINPFLPRDRKLTKQERQWFQNSKDQSKLSPTQGQKDALVGTSGTPSSSNKYVTDSDPRLLPAPVAVGTFTLTAGRVTVVSESAITASSVVIFSPINASAAARQGADKPYESASERVVGVSFTMRIDVAGAVAAGTEQYSYIVYE